MKLSACIEWLFASEVADFADRIRACAKAGIQAIEFHLWRDKQLDAIAAALDETGVELVAFVNDPRRHLTKRETHADFFADFAEALKVAQRLNAAAVLATIGPAPHDRTRDEQRAAVVAAFSRAARMAHDAGKVVFIEALNSVVDHPGFFLTSTAAALDIADEVDHPGMKVLYDFYHSTMMGEDPRSVLTGRIERVGHVQVADAPGRHEPGSGQIDWPAQMRLLAELGYTGAIGLEYKPRASTGESLSMSRLVLQAQRLA
jgi:hydroxypyruvate isomerase